MTRIGISLLSLLAFIAVIQGMPPGKPEVLAKPEEAAKPYKEPSKFKRFARATAGFVKGVAVAPFHMVAHGAKAAVDFVTPHFFWERNNYGNPMSGISNIGEVIRALFYHPYREAYNGWYKDEIRTGDKKYLGSTLHDYDSDGNRQKLFKIIQDEKIDPKVAKGLRSKLKFWGVDDNYFKSTKENIESVARLNRELDLVKDKNSADYKRWKTQLDSLNHLSPDSKTLQEIENGVIPQLLKENNLDAYNKLQGELQKDRSGEHSELSDLLVNSNIKDYRKYINTPIQAENNNQSD